MSHSAMSRLNSRHHFTSQDATLHGDGKSQSPFAQQSKAVSQEEPTAVKWSQVDASLRGEVAKKELEAKLRHRGPSKQSLRATQSGDLLEAASVVLKASRDEGDEEDDYGGEVFGWRFDNSAEADAENDMALRYDGQGATIPASSPEARNDSDELIAVQSFRISGRPEPGSLVERSSSFMKLHALKGPASPKRGSPKNENGAMMERTVSFISTVDAALGTLGTKKHVAQVPSKKAVAAVQRDDVFPSGAHKIDFSPTNPAPPEQEYKTLFDIKDVGSFKHDQQQQQQQSATRRKLDPLTGYSPNNQADYNRHGPSSPIHATPPKSMITFAMRPPPLDLNVTAGGSAVTNQSLPVSAGLRKPPPMSPLYRVPSHSTMQKSPLTPSNASRGGGSTPKSAGHRDGSNASPLAAASSSFLMQALKKTSSFLSIPLPTLALVPVKQEVAPTQQQIRGGSPVANPELEDSMLGKSRNASSDPLQKHGILSERHKKVIADASPGIGTPVIYIPQSSKEESNTVYSGTMSMLGVGSPKFVKFKPSSLKHLDLNHKFVEDARNHQSMTVSILDKFNISDVGPANPVKDFDAIWSACWDDEAGAVYYYNKKTGEATWLPPKPEAAAVGANEEEDDDGDFFQLLNRGLPPGLGEFNMGDSELAIKTRKITARQNLWAKMRNRYEGDAETEFSNSLKEKEKVHYAKLEDSEVLWEYQKELTDWFVLD